VTEVSIEYTLGQHGWSSFKLTAGDKTIDIGEFGYCTDALGDLVRAALLIAANGSRAEACFDSEPMEWRLVVERDWTQGLPATALRLRVLTFDSFWPEAPASDGKVMLDAYVAADAFADAVRTAAQRIWDTYGPHGYDDAWNGMNGFPLRALKALKAALTEQDEPARRWGITPA
jgi:hypothetical protein